MRQQPDQPHRTTLSDPVRVGAGLAGWQLALALIPSYEYKARAGINQGSVSEAETPRPTERCFRRGFLSCLAQLPNSGRLWADGFLSEMIASHPFVASTSQILDLQHLLQEIEN